MSADIIERHLAEAHRAKEAGRPDLARPHLEAVLAIDADEPFARNALGADALALSDATTAAEHFEIACRREPNERTFWINLATARRALGDPKAERAALDKALGLDQTDLLALIRLAELHEREGQTNLAADRWSAVIRLSSTIQDPSPEFRQLLDRARSFVEEQRGLRASAVDTALAGDLASASVRDGRRMRAAADAWLGRRAIYTNHCEGMHYPFLPADEFFDRDQFPWLERLEEHTAAIAAEVQALLAAPGARLEPYISMPDGTPANKWTALDKSLDWGALHLWKEGVRYDETCARAPATAAVVESLPMCRIQGRAPNVFFSVLKAGSLIPPHTGTTNVRGVIHLPLIVPPGCGFRVGGETREWRVGEAFAFDDTIEHEAWNRSDEDRIVLILDAWNPHLSKHEQTMVCRLYEAADQQRAG